MTSVYSIYYQFIFILIYFKAFHKLHEAIRKNDFDEFKKLVDPQVTTFEPSCKVGVKS